MRDDGFTLLEVLVAFVIAAISVVALLQGAGAGLASARIAAHYGEALSLARSRLALLSAAAPIPGEQSGILPGGFAWRSMVQQVAAVARPAAGGGSAPPRRAALYSVVITVSWTADGPRREVVLSTQRVAAAPAAPP